MNPHPDPDPNSTRKKASEDEAKHKEQNERETREKERLNVERKMLAQKVVNDSAIRLRVKNRVGVRSGGENVLPCGMNRKTCTLTLPL